MENKNSDIKEFINKVASGKPAKKLLEKIIKRKTEERIRKILKNDSGK